MKQGERVVGWGKMAVWDTCFGMVSCLARLAELHLRFAKG